MNTKLCDHCHALTQLWRLQSVILAGSTETDAAHRLSVCPSCAKGSAYTIVQMCNECLTYQPLPGGRIEPDTEEDRYDYVAGAYRWLCSRCADVYGEEEAILSR